MKERSSMMQVFDTMHKKKEEDQFDTYKQRTIYARHVPYNESLVKKKKKKKFWTGIWRVGNRKKP